MTTNNGNNDKKGEQSKRGLRGGGSSHRRGLRGGGSNHSRRGRSSRSPTRGGGGGGLGGGSSHHSRQSTSTIGDTETSTTPNSSQTTLLQQTSNLVPSHRGLRRPPDEVRAKIEAAARLATTGTSTRVDAGVDPAAANPSISSKNQPQQEQEPRRRSPSPTPPSSTTGSTRNTGGKELVFIRDKGLANRACVTCKIQPTPAHHQSNGRSTKGGAAATTDLVLARAENQDTESGAILSHVTDSSTFSVGSIQAFPSLSSSRQHLPITTRPGAVHVNPSPLPASTILENATVTRQITNHDDNNDSPDDQERSASELIVTATTVDEDDLEKNIRNRILHEAVEADVVTTTCDWQYIFCSNKKKTVLIVIILCVAILVVGIVVGVVTEKLDTTNGSSSSPEGSEQQQQQQQAEEMNDPVVIIAEEAPMTTMELVRQRGHLNCGVYAFRKGFANYAYNGEIEGFNWDQCRAIATVVFGDPNKVEPVIITGADRLPMLANGTIDVLASTVTHTMGRDIYDRQSDSGFAFSTPYYYSGTIYAGRPPFVDCAERLDTTTGNCTQLKICANFASTQYFTTLDLFPSGAVVPSSSIVDIAESLVNGECNAAAVEQVAVDQKRLNDYGYEDPYKSGTKFFSKDPLTLVTREEDPEWSSLVDLVVNIFFLAEAHNITVTNAADMARISGEDQEMAARAVAIVSNFGNYNEMYQRHIQQIVPRSGLNILHTTASASSSGSSSSSSSSGLMYSHPFGTLSAKGSGPVADGTLQTILVRGHLRCGVIPRPGFAQHHPETTTPNDGDDWSGFDIQFCRAVSAALFGGEEAAVVYVNVGDENSSSSQKKAYSALASGGVDVVAGSRVTLQAKYKEPATGKGYSFSPPTFFDNEGGDAFALVTNQDDYQWSDFVYWVVSSLVYAEEMGITQTEAEEEMPPTKLFGEGLQQMLQQAVKAVGSYGQIYNQTLEETIPRSGRNLLQMQDMAMEGPQQFSIPAF